MKTVATILLSLSLAFVGCKSSDPPAEEAGTEQAECAKCKDAGKEACECDKNAEKKDEKAEKAE
jgi:hypothetical protein